MKQYLLSTGLVLAGSLTAFSQSTFAPLNSDYYHLPDRYEIRSGRMAEGFFTSSKAYERKGIAQLADTLLADSSMQSQLSATDRFNLTYLQNDNAEWSKTAQADSKKPILKYFYTRKPDLYHYSDKEFDLHVNPVLYIMAGQDNDAAGRPYINTRGIEVRGMINKKVGFYTFMADNQARFAGYAENYIDSIKAVPTEAFDKKFEGNLVGKGAAGHDFITARGYISANITKNINVQFGQDRHFIGNGYRSMILSDFATSYPFLKLNTRIWRFQYTNLFAQMKTSSRIPNDELISNKYMALHHLSLNVTKNLNIGIFETIMFSREDKQGSFDWAYLNPIIFYRGVEQQQGSRDNAFLGLDFKWNFLKHLSLYGQVLLDEFKLDEVKAGNGWWGNKQSGQLGIKYIDALGIRNLDLQAEMNIARPYTYAHKDNYGSYAHYNQALAHPLGANFSEYIGIMRYQPVGRLNLVAKLIISEYGEDSPAFKNTGSNILKSYSSNRQEYNNKIGQGVKAKQLFADFTVSYQLKHNLFLDVKAIYRDKKSDDDALSRTTTFVSGALRWNIGQRLHEF